VIFAVIVAVPSATAVMVPPSTVATLSAEEVHATTALFGTAVAMTVASFPASIVSAEADRETLGVSLFGWTVSGV
jgi:hypothetical protein